MSIEEIPSPQSSKLGMSGNRGRPCGSCAEENILAAAVHVFVEKGYQEATVADLLKFSGCSRTNFYRFYKSKEDVFEELFGQTMGAIQFQINDAFEKSLDLDGMENQVRYVVDAYLDACFNIGALAKVFFQEQWSSPSRIALREGVIRAVDKGLEKIAVANEKQKPNSLLVEGILAGIDRIVTKQLDEGVDEKQKSLARESIYQLIHLGFR